MTLSKVLSLKAYSLTEYKVQTSPKVTKHYVQDAKNECLFPDVGLDRINIYAKKEMPDKLLVGSD